LVSTNTSGPLPFPRGSSSTSPERVPFRVHAHFSLRPSTWLERVSPPIIEGIFKHYPPGYAPARLLRERNRLPQFHYITVSYSSQRRLPPLVRYRSHRSLSISRWSLIRFSLLMETNQCTEALRAFDPFGDQCHKVPKRSSNGHPRPFQRFDLLISSSAPSGDDRPGVAHAPGWRG